MTNPPKELDARPPTDTESSQEADSNPTPLHATMVGTSQGVTTLGLITARLLQQQGEAHLHINASGLVEVIPRGEIELDLLPESDSLARLLEAGYTDSQLESYLAARDQRARRR